MGRKTAPFSVAHCRRCGEKIAKGIVTPANTEYAIKFGVRCPDCWRWYRKSLASRKATVLRNKAAASEFRAKFMEAYKEEPFQADHTLLPPDSDSPMGAIDQLGRDEGSTLCASGRAPAWRRARGC